MTNVLDQSHVHGSKTALTIDVISDVICPWCYIGKRNLDRALVTLRQEFEIAVRWRPFELNPDMPKEGVDRRQYRTQKFGSWEESQARDAQVAAAGQRAGLAFRHDLMARTPNTIDAHRLIWVADGAGLQEVVVEALFVAYFTQGRDIGDHAVLAEIADNSGLDRGQVEGFLAGDLGRDDVRAMIEAAYRAGINGVPTVVVNGRPAFSGGHPPETMVAEIRAAL